MSGKDNLSTWDLEVIGKLIQRDKEIAALKQQVIDARRAAIEECAKIVEDCDVVECGSGYLRADDGRATLSAAIKAIRALAGPTG